MKLYYAGDVHGSEKCWRKFLGAARFYEVDTLIMGGDITGKLMVPIVARADGRHEATVLGRRETVTDDGLEDLEKRIRFNGFYPYRCDRAEYDRLSGDREYRDAVFTDLMVEEVRPLGRARRGAARRHRRPLLRHAGERRRVRDRRRARVDDVVNPDNRVVRVDEETQMLSCSWTNPTPVGQPAGGARGGAARAAARPGRAARAGAEHDLQPALPARTTPASTGRRSSRTT